MSRSHERLYQLLADRVQLGSRARWALGLTLLALLGSGIAWLAVHFAGELGLGPGDELGRIAGEAVTLKVHGAAALATLIALGAMLAAHARPAWALQRNRASGTVVLAGFALLTASGYALWYFATDETRPPLSLLHWATGLAIAAVLPVHIAFGRSSRASRATPRPESQSRRAS